jgi:hypothetical protein
MSYYNHITKTESARLPVPLTLDSIAWTKPNPAQYNAAGWVLQPVEPFQTPEGYERVAGTRRVEFDGTTAREVFDVETTAEAAERRMKARAWGLPQTVADAYNQFHIVFEQAVVAAIAAGAQLDPGDISYQNLMHAIAQLEGEQWLKLADVLRDMWRIVEIRHGGTPAQVYADQDAMDYRRLNPPPEPEPFDEDIV